MKFIQQISGRPGSGKIKTVFTSKATSKSLTCSQFFMTMQDRETDLAGAKKYAKIGPQLAPAADWDEINRVLNTF